MMIIDDDDIRSNLRRRTTPELQLVISQKLGGRLSNLAETW